MYFATRLIIVRRLKVSNGGPHPDQSPARPWYFVPGVWRWEIKHLGVAVCRNRTIDAVFFNVGSGWCRGSNDLIGDRWFRQPIPEFANLIGT